MTEAEWLACDDPYAMFDFLGDSATDRKLRLLACCFRDRWYPALYDVRSRSALEVSERFADGLATEEELFVASDEATKVFRAAVSLYGIRDERFWAAEWVHFAVFPGRASNRFASISSADAATVCARIRDLFGNPFRPVAFSPSWHTDTVLLLASHMYGSRDFSAMSILADALQDTGCDDHDILNHCRQPSEHGRGCWVADLILGYE